MERNWRGLRRPLVAIALGLLPFWLFLGFSNEVRVNGELVGGSRFNLGGLVLAGIGLSMAVGVLRETPRWAPRLALAALAVPICLAQLAVSAELVPVERLRLWLAGPPQPDPATRLSDRGREILLLTAAEPGHDEVMLRDMAIRQARRLQALVAEHAAYAGFCHGGARFAMPPLPAWLSEAERGEIAAAAHAPRTATAPGCSEAASLRLMKQLVEDAMVERDRLLLTVQLREQRHGTAPAPAPPPPWQLDDAPLALGDSLAAVQARLAPQGEPQPVPGAQDTSPLQTSLVVAPGITAWFDGAQRVCGLQLEENFAGRLGGVALGDRAPAVQRRHGEPDRFMALGPLRGMVYAPDGRPAVRYDLRGSRVVAMQLLR